ncbi:MAG: glycosyltransferase family 2 protein [Jannaschia sp.]
MVPFPAPSDAPPGIPFRPRPITLDDPDVLSGAAAILPRFQRVPYIRRRQIGQLLLDSGTITESELTRALFRQRETGTRVGDILIRNGNATEADVTAALGRQHGMGQAGPPPPDDPTLDALARRLPMENATEYRALPWARIGQRTLVATARPDLIDDLARDLPDELGPCLFAVVSDRALDARMGVVHGPAMARSAECQVPEALSCRRLRDRSGSALMALIPVAMCAAALFWPTIALGLATMLGLLVAALNTGLRTAAFVAVRRSRKAGGPFATVRTCGAAAGKLPVISILVPLHREPEIAAPLSRRLARIDYPRELLDICLVVEEDDAETLAALDRADLPPWMRVIAVPDGHPRTKPRAMNYALNFARGDIVGIYDAEDAPAPDQLLKVAARFRAAPDDVACLQGLLDFYNPTRNWMSRCFTIEYANWFRLVLPGIARMGLVVPLGGTTLFFRREALDRVGGWDAHNVTEDADLGVRLARLGYRTEILQTTTLEEANASPLAWVKQRSRWMKGYVLTWAVHSRRPLRLWRDLGTKRFLGFHLLFLGAILNALLMPFMWSTIVVAFGMWHPVLDMLPGSGTLALAMVIVTLTVANMALAMAGCAAAHHRNLRRWVPTLEAYFPLATLAVGKALAEIVMRPFHWDKTAHGGFGGDDSTEAIEDLHDALDGPQAMRRTA